MTKSYRVVFLGFNGEKDTFLNCMLQLGVEAEMVDTMIAKAPIVLKDEMTLDYAQLYGEAIQQAGGVVIIQEDGPSKDRKKIRRSVHILPLDHFIMCPECGHKQVKAEICKRCGSTLIKKPDIAQGEY